MGQGQWLPRVMAAAMQTNRLGNDWWVGGYHYVHFMEDPIVQVDFYLAALKSAGHETTKKGWLWPILDVERAENPDCSAQQIVDCVTTMANEIFNRTGKRPTLYGGSLLYDKQIKDHMGCARLWIARYCATLPAQVYERIGWSINDLLMWQYDGDGQGYLANYPVTSPIGKTDISALVCAGGLSFLQNNL